MQHEYFIIGGTLLGERHKHCILIYSLEQCWFCVVAEVRQKASTALGLMTMNDCYATCFISEISRRKSPQTWLRVVSYMTCFPFLFHNLPFVSFRWWRFIYFGCGRTTNKVTITASCSISVLLVFYHVDCRRVQRNSLVIIFSMYIFSMFI